MINSMLKKLKVMSAMLTAHIDVPDDEGKKLMPHIFMAMVIGFYLGAGNSDKKAIEKTKKILDRMEK